MLKYGHINYEDENENVAIDKKVNEDVPLITRYEAVDDVY